LLSVIFGNRAACYMMCRDYEKAGEDCFTAYEFVVKDEQGAASSSQRVDWVLAVKLGLRRARALTKLGQCQTAKDVYGETLRVARENSVSDLNAGVVQECEKGYSECGELIDALRTIYELGKMREEAGMSRSNKKGDEVGNRIVKMADSILSQCPASKKTVILKVGVLGDRCDHPGTIAAVEKHARSMPYHTIPTQSAGAGAAVAGVVAKLLSAELLLAYLQALRLDDRCGDAMAALDGVEGSKEELAGVAKELFEARNRVKRLSESKGKGDVAFRKESYEECVDCYTAALQVRRASAERTCNKAKVATAGSRRGMRSRELATLGPLRANCSFAHSFWHPPLFNPRFARADRLGH